MIHGTQIDIFFLLQKELLHKIHYLEKGKKEKKTCSESYNYFFGAKLNSYIISELPDDWAVKCERNVSKECCLCTVHNLTSHRLDQLKRKQKTEKKICFYGVILFAKIWEHNLVCSWRNKCFFLNYIWIDKNYLMKNR